MKKYFMTQTNEEVKLGDRLEVDFTKDCKGKVIHHHIDCKLIPELLPLFIENDVIYCKDIEEPKEPVNEEKQYSLKDIEDRLIYLEGKVAELSEAIDTNIKNIAYLFSKNSCK